MELILTIINRLTGNVNLRLPDTYSNQRGLNESDSIKVAKTSRQ